MSFVAVDYLFAMIILIFAIISLNKGFVSEVFGKAAWVLGVICGVFFYKDVAQSLKSKLTNELVCNVLSFLIIFVVIFLIVKLCEYILARIFELSILRSLDRGLGLIFGIVEGFAVVCLVIFVLSVQPFFNVENLFEGSFFAGLMHMVLNSAAANGVKENV